MEKPAEVGLVLLIDQFEGFLDSAGMEAAALCLGELARRGRVIVIATMRSDAYARLIKIPDLLALKEAGEVLDVASPDPAAVGDPRVSNAAVVCAPAASVGGISTER